MKNYHYLTILIFFLLFSCKNTDTTTTTQKTTVEDTIAVELPPVIDTTAILDSTPVIQKIKRPVRKTSHWQAILNSQTIVKVFKGNIGDHAIEMVLMVEADDHLNGFCFHSKDSKGILRLNGTKEEETKLYEWDDHINNTGVFIGHFNEKAGIFEGIWEDSSGTLKEPFLLEQITPKRPSKKSIEGVYSYEIDFGDPDSRNPNGTATIKRSGDHYNMVLDVFLSGHTGDLDAEFRINRLAGDIMRVNYEHSKERDCLMDIILYKNVLYIEERHCMDYHGDRASFWGLYFKQ